MGRCSRRAFRSELETSDKITKMHMKKMPIAIITSISEKARRFNAGSAAIFIF
jgi:hypothetical protein